MSNFGLDIGSHSIKVMELAKNGKSISLVASGIAATPAGGLSTDSEKSLQEVSTAIKKLVSDTKITTKNVVFALPEQHVYTRVISFPPLADEEINSAIEWQAEGYIPIPKKDSVLDWEVVSKSDRGVEVLLIAAPRALVDKYMKVVQMAGLNTVAVETELVALARSVAPVEGVALIADFGATSTDLAITVNRQLMFVRSIPTAGAALTRAVATGIGVQSQQAEEYKKTYGLSTALEGKVKQALSSVVSPLVDEVKKAIGFWQQEHQDKPVQIGILTGGTAGLPELVPSIASSLGIEITIGNPFGFVTLDPRTSKALSSYSPLYAIAVGLAMRDLA